MKLFVKKYIYIIKFESAPTACITHPDSNFNIMQNKYKYMNYTIYIENITEYLVSVPKPEPSSFIMPVQVANPLYCLLFGHTVRM